MDNQHLEELAAHLCRKRSALLQEVTESEECIKTIAEERESELLESAQKDHITRVTSHLNQRDQRMIREIDTAFERIVEGVYGECESCGTEIGIARLRAIPTATLCIECATMRERKARSSGPEEISERIPLSEQEFETPPAEKEDER